MGNCIVCGRFTVSGKIGDTPWCSECHPHNQGFIFCDCPDFEHKKVMWSVEVERFYHEMGRSSRLRIDEEYDKYREASNRYDNIVPRTGKSFWEKKRLGSGHINEEGDLEIDDWERMEESPEPSVGQGKAK